MSWREWLLCGKKLTALASPISTTGDVEWNDCCENGVRCAEGGRKFAQCSASGSIEALSGGPDRDVRGWFVGAVLSDSIRANVLRTSSSAATLRSRRCSDVIEFALELLRLVGAEREELLAGTGGGNRLSLPRVERFIPEVNDSDTARL